VIVSFSAGEEIIVSLTKNSTTGTCSGVVVNADSDDVQVALRGRGFLVKNGVLLHVRSATEPTHSAWARLQSSELAGDVKLIHLSDLRFDGESKARAARCQIDLSLTAAFNDGRDQNTKRTIGQSINISMTGIRARFRSTVPQGISVHVAIHLAPDQIVEAIVRVVRIVSGSESASGGYEVGLEFQRFIRGYDFLLEALPQGTEVPAAGEDQEWVA